MDELDQTNTKWIMTAAALIGLIIVSGLVLATGSVQVLLGIMLFLIVCVPIGIVMIRHYSKNG